MNVIRKFLTCVILLCSVLYSSAQEDDAEEIYLVTMSVDVPAIIREPLMILAWDNNTKKPIAKVIEFAPSKFRYGTYPIVNFSKLPLGGYIVAKSNKITCKPSKAYITSFAIKDGEPSPTVFYTRVNNELQKAFGSITIHRKKRAIYLMYPEKNKLGRLIFQSTVIVDIEKQKEQ